MADSVDGWYASQIAAGKTAAEVDAYLSRQLDFDPDVWVVEVEDRQGRHFLDDWLAPR